MRQTDESDSETEESEHSDTDTADSEANTDEHLAEIADGCGCVEIWENLSEYRQDTE